MGRAWAVIPTLDEAAAIAEVVRGVPRELCAGVAVVDGGSRDGTAEAARAAGALVVVEPRRGYGRAVTRGAEAARAAGAEAYVFFDGNGTVDPADVRRVLAPVAAGAADLVIGTRRAEGLRPLQRLGNRLAVAAIARAHGYRYEDVGSVRAIGAGALAALDLREPGYGWPLALQVRAAARGFRIFQVPITPRPRRGRSKVSGTVRGTVGASLAFLRVLAVECLP